MIKFISTYSLLAAIFYHLSVFCVASSLNEMTDDYFDRQERRNWLSEPIPHSVLGCVNCIKDFKEALSHVKQSNNLPIVMPIGDRSLHRLNTVLDHLSLTLTDSATNLRDINQIFSIVSHLKGAKLIHHRFLHALESAMLHHSESLSHYHVISTFYEMSNILYTPSILFQRMLKRHVDELIADFDPKIHLRQSSGHHSAKSPFPDYYCPFLNPQDLLAQLIISYSMMPADAYNKVKMHFGDDNFPPTLASDGLQRIVEQYNNEKASHNVLFYHKHTQFLHWSLLVDAKRNNRTNSHASITTLILREKQNWHPTSVSSITERFVAEQLGRDKKLPGTRLKKTFLDRYTVLQNVKLTELFTEVDFVISNKAMPDDIIYIEIDGQHHFIRHLDNEAGDTAYTIGSSLPATSNGQTLLKTEALLTKGKVIRMPTLGTTDAYFNRMRMLPQRINGFYHWGKAPLLLIEPHFYGVAYASFDVSEKVVLKRASDSQLADSGLTVRSKHQRGSKKQRPF